ncbi:MAG: preprotein translocase subunit SecE [Nevskiales bacterium]
MRAVKEVQQQMAAGGAGAPEPEGPVNKLKSYPGRAAQFLHDVRMEMRNVTWPTTKDVQATTIVVVVATFFFGFYLGAALDVPIAKLMTWLLKVGRTLAS